MLKCVVWMWGPYTEGEGGPNWGSSGQEKLGGSLLWRKDEAVGLPWKRAWELREKGWEGPAASAGAVQGEKEGPVPVLPNFSHQIPPKPE